MPEELWTEVPDILQEAGIKTIPKKKKCKEAKWLSDEGLQIVEKRREAKGKGEMEKSKMSVWGGLTNSCEKKRSEKQRRKGKIFPFEGIAPKNNKEIFKKSLPQ